MAGIPASAHYRDADSPDVSCASCLQYDSGYCDLWQTDVGPTMTCDEWEQIVSDHAAEPLTAAVATAERVPVAELVRLLQLGYRRAEDLEPKLARILLPILEAAGEEAARAFSRLATDHLTAALRGDTKADVTESSAMVALYPTAEQAASIAETDGEAPELMHVTLCYLGKDVPEDAVQRIAAALAVVAGTHPPLEGTVGGIGSFGDGGSGYPAIALPNVPGLVELRQDVCEAVIDAGGDYPRDHGYMPHLTVAYRDEAPLPPTEAVLGLPLSFGSIHVVRGNEVVAELPLTGVTSLTAAAHWTSPAADELIDVDKLVSTLRTKTDPVRMAVVETMMTPVLGGAGIAFDATNPLTAKVLSQAGSQVTNIAQTTQLNVMRVIRAATDEGLTIPDTAKAIRAGMKEASTARATLIARTEIVGAVNGGSLAATQIVSDVTGVAYHKTWITSPGAQYPRHELYDGLDGQTVGLEEVFDVGGAPLDFPGDPNGPADEVCNCRCTMTYEDAEGEGEGDAEGGELPTVSDSGGVSQGTWTPPTTGKTLALKEAAAEGSTYADWQGLKRLTPANVEKKMQAVVNDYTEFYGLDREPAVARFEPEATAAWDTDARTLVAPTSGDSEIWYGQEIMDKARDPDSGVFPFRQISHEAGHTINSAGTHGFAHEFEEGGAEVLSLRYWAERGQPFDARDAVRVDGKWTDAGLDSLAHSVIYRDYTMDVMRRAASRVGWDRDRITADVLEMMKGDHGARLRWRDATNPDFALPPGVRDDAPDLMRWFLDPAHPVLPEPVLMAPREIQVVGRLSTDSYVAGLQQELTSLGNKIGNINYYLKRDITADRRAEYNHRLKALERRRRDVRELIATPDPKAELERIANQLGNIRYYMKRGKDTLEYRHRLEILEARQAELKRLIRGDAKEEIVAQEKKVEAVAKVEAQTKPAELFSTEVKPGELVAIDWSGARPESYTWLVQRSPGYGPENYYKLGPGEIYPGGTGAYSVGEQIVVQDRSGVILRAEVPAGHTANDSAAVARLMQAQFDKLQADTPEWLRGKKLEQVVSLKGRNPADPYWAERYNIPGFESAATGGRGNITFYSDRFWRSGQQSTFDHEMGHIVGRNGGPLDIEEWGEAVEHDLNHGRDEFGLTGQVSVYDIHHTIYVGGDAVSDYGSKSVNEDWAESIRLYVNDKRWGELGTIRTPTGNRQLTFENAFPARAQLIERWLRDGDTT